LRGHRRAKEVPWQDGEFDAPDAGGVVFHAASGLEATAIADLQG